MSKVMYSFTMSVDGYVAGPDGDFGWSVPDEELHRFHNERVGALGAQMLGRRLYETMVPWETDPALAAAGDVPREFATIWKALPKVVFSTTLDRVEGNARLATGTPEEELARLREEVPGDIAVGGAGLAAGLMRQGLIDEFQIFVAPAVVGGGTPFFPPLDGLIDLELLETRTFGGGIVYLRYARA
jgi:dihydrofolate reductase